MPDAPNIVMPPVWLPGSSAVIASLPRRTLLKNRLVGSVSSSPLWFSSEKKIGSRNTARCGVGSDSKKVSAPAAAPV